MHIICPHCRTSYAINLASLGAGRTIRCSDCQEVWLARPEDTIETTAPAVADRSAAPANAGDNRSPYVRGSASRQTPIAHSPIAGDWPAEGDAARNDTEQEELPDNRRQPQPGRPPRKPARRTAPRKPFLDLPTACAAMGALVVALVIWRADVARLLPQTASFYKLVGLGVNLRGLAFSDLKLTRETVDGKPVLVIEGVIVGQTRKPVDMPPLRFSVRDAQGTEIYTWNTTLEQATLKPGEHAPFKSRLASPPAEGRGIEIQFSNRRDVAGRNV